MTEKEKYSQLVRKLYEGTTDSEENSLLGSMSESRHEELFREVSDEAWENASGQIDEDTESRMQNDILSRISSYNSVITSRTKRRNNIMLQIAAAAAIAVIFAFSGYWLSGGFQDEEFYELITENGQKSSITLPDGSTIHLNSGSRIIYSSNFNKKDRNIELDGEAYFEVAKNTRLPFIVHAKEMDVTALGTKFNVKAYGGDNRITATLVQGCIRTDAGGQTKTISPSTRVCYDITSKTMKAEKINSTETATAWLENRIIFDEESLEEIAGTLTRMYNVDIAFMDDRCRSIQYSGLVRNNSLDNILNLITTAAPVRYRINGNTIEFSTK